MVRSLVVHILWSSEINLSQVTTAIKREYKEEFEYGVYTDGDLPRLMETYKQAKLSELKSKYRQTLDGTIIVIADIERWSKRFMTAEYLNTNRVDKIFKTLDDGTDIRWYIDSYNVRGDEVTKSGINHYIFRELRTGKNLNKLKYRLRNGEAVTPQLLNYYTKTLLPYFSMD